MTTERIDVLAVMDREIDAIRNTKAIADVGLCGARKAAYAEHLSNMEEARAAVAELIEAARSASATLSHIYHTVPLRPDLEQHAHDGYQRLDAALAVAAPTPQKRHCDHDWVVKTVPTGFADVCCLCGADKGTAALARVGGAS